MAWSFFEGILYSNRVNTWPGPFLKQLCIVAWSFFDGSSVSWPGPFLNELCVSAWSFFEQLTNI